MQAGKGNKQTIKSFSLHAAVDWAKVAEIRYSFGWDLQYCWAENGALHF